MNLSILYRGPLSSCNYGCEYCPFAKHTSSDEELTEDRRALERFTNWISEQKQHRIGILFTPWGEALIRRWYQEALVSLTQMSNVQRAVIQTNVSCGVRWVEDCNKEKLALWTTFHPTEITRERFVNKCMELVERNVRFSVGVVGLKEHFSEIELLREELPDHVYVWVNAYKRERDYYSLMDLERLEKTDPFFRTNTIYHSSMGKECNAGHSVISVDGDGTMRRCHFIRDPIGNIYDPNYEFALKKRDCTNLTCGCHIGYVHLVELNQDKIYGEGILERIPTEWSALASGGRKPPVENLTNR